MLKKRLCGVRTSYRAVCKCFPRISTVQRRCAARTCRTRSARLLAALKPPLRRLLGRRRSRLRCRHSGANAPRPSFYFFSKRSKTRKAKNLGMKHAWNAIHINRQYEFTTQTVKEPKNRFGSLHCLCRGCIFCKYIHPITLPYKDRTA